MKLFKSKQMTHRASCVRQTLAHDLHKRWPVGVEACIFFVILRGRPKPQPSQCCVSFFFSNKFCIGHRIAIFNLQTRVEKQTAIFFIKRKALLSKKDCLTKNNYDFHLRPVFLWFAQPNNRC